jgi:gamma-glutamyltranspeptidase/glutathione hydrolase
MLRRSLAHRLRALLTALALATGLGAVTCATAQDVAILSAKDRFHPVAATNGMVATQEETATRIGVDILRRGGNAVDAAVAVGFALAVTLPRAGNLGGGGFMLVRLAGTGEVVAIDYRE